MIMGRAKQAILLISLLGITIAVSGCPKKHSHSSSGGGAAPAPGPTPATRSIARNSSFDVCDGNCGLGGTLTLDNNFNFCASDNLSGVADVGSVSGFAAISAPPASFTSCVLAQVGHGYVGPTSDGAYAAWYAQSYSTTTLIMVLQYYWPSFVKKLTVTVGANGTVTSSPAGINCGPSQTCSHYFKTGTVVTLTASGQDPYALRSWGTSACTAPGTCSLQMDADKLATLTFGTALLTVTIPGSGSVTSSPAGINCPGTCSSNFAPGTQVTLSPSAGSGYIFTSWGGACSGSGNCVVNFSADTTVSALFCLGTGLQQFTSAGTYSFQAGYSGCPQPNVTVSVWGAGGGGGVDNPACPGNSGGGGGGGYGQSQFSLNPGGVYSIVVGGGGQRGNMGAGCVGGSGGTSSFGTLISASGGGGGTASGGTGGSSTALTNTPGTSGEASTVRSFSGATYGYGGSGGNGGAGGQLSVGTAPGGGGSGQYTGFSFGFAGADGKVTVSW